MLPGLDKNSGQIGRYVMQKMRSYNATTLIEHPAIGSVGREGSFFRMATGGGGGGRVPQPPTPVGRGVGLVVSSICTPKRTSPGVSTNLWGQDVHGGIAATVARGTNAPERKEGFRRGNPPRGGFAGRTRWSTSSMCCGSGRPPTCWRTCAASCWRSGAGWSTSVCAALPRHRRQQDISCRQVDWRCFTSSSSVAVLLGIIVAAFTVNTMNCLLLGLSPTAYAEQMYGCG